MILLSVFEPGSKPVDSRRSKLIDPLRRRGLPDNVKPPVLIVLVNVAFFKRSYINAA